MEDTYEFVTNSKHGNTLYKVTSSAIAFEVKAARNALVGLATKPDTRCSFWIFIGYYGRCWIKTEGFHKRPEIIPNVLDPNEFKKFWITWFGGSVCLGRGGETEPLLKHPCIVPSIKYVTFSVVDDLNPITWRFDLPPVLERPKLRPICGEEPYWVRPDTQLPNNAIIGGYEQEILYIIRAAHRGSLTPGKFALSQGVGFIAWGGSAIDKEDIEVLCGSNYIWAQTFEDRIPINAVVGGYSELGREKLYIGRYVCNGSMIPGKVQMTHKTCYIAYEGREVSDSNYEILVSPSFRLGSAHPYLLQMPVNIEYNFETEDVENYEETEDEME